MWCRLEDRRVDHWNGIESSTLGFKVVFGKCVRLHSAGQGAVSSANGVGKTGHTCVKESDLYFGLKSKQ